MVTLGEELRVHVPALEPRTVLLLHRLLVQRRKMEASVGRSGEGERLGGAEVSCREGSLTHETDHVDAGHRREACERRSWSARAPRASFESRRTEGDVLSTLERLLEHFILSSMAVQPASCPVEAAVELVLLLRLQVLLLGDDDEFVRVEGFLDLVEVGVCSWKVSGGRKSQRTATDLRDR